MGLEGQIPIQCNAKNLESSFNFDALVSPSFLLGDTALFRPRGLNTRLRGKKPAASRLNCNRRKKSIQRRAGIRHNSAISSKQIALALTLDLLSGRSGLSIFQNKPGERLEETDAASKQKSFIINVYYYSFVDYLT